MDLIKLIGIFVVILIFIKLNKPLYISVSMGIFTCILIYNIPIKESLKLIVKGVTDNNTINLILAFYTITFIQRMMESKGFLLLAEKTLYAIFNSKRVNAMVAPFIIGILPSPGAVLIAAPIVENSAGKHLKIEEKAFVASHFRHISESFLPTYSSVLLALRLGNINTSKFVFYMIPMVVLLFLLGYFFYIKKIPKEKYIKSNINKINEIKKLVKYLWPIILVIVLILGFGLPVYYATIITIMIFIILGKFKILELIPMLKTSFELRLILSTITIIIFSKFISYIGIIYKLPIYFNRLDIAPVYVFMIIFMISTLMAGSQATIALVIPLAFATIPSGGVPLMVLLMCVTYITMQISPTHICLAIVTEHFNITFIELFKKTFYIFIIFIISSLIYFYILTKIV